MDEGTSLRTWLTAARRIVPFFRGAHLDPPPPKGSKHPDVRYCDIHKYDDLDEAQLASWFEQASRLPGKKM